MEDVAYLTSPRSAAAATCQHCRRRHERVPAVRADSARSCAFRGMKALLLTAAAILLAGGASAQTPVPAVELPRADAHFVIGWQNLRRDQPQSSYNAWLNGIVYAGGGAGWYWTDHVKTQVDVG